MSELLFDRLREFEKSLQDIINVVAIFRADSEVREDNNSSRQHRRLCKTEQCRNKSNNWGRKNFYPYIDIPI